MSILGFIISSIPIIRGYYQWGTGDSFSHLQWVQEIALTGHVPEGLIYPFSHIYLVIIGLVTNLNYLTIMGNFKFLICIPALLFSFLFTKEFLGERCAGIFLFILIFSASAMSLYFTAYLIPGYLFFLIIYLFIALVHKTGNSRNSFFILLTILIFAIVPGHPFVVINCAIIMIIAFLFLKYEKYRTTIQNPLTIIPFFVLIVSFLFWISQFYIFQKTLIKMYDVFFIQHDTSEFALLQQSIEYASSYGYNWVEMFCKVYGNSAITLLFSIFALYIILKENQKIKMKIALILILTFVFIICTGILYLTKVGFTPDRMFSTAIIFSGLLVVFVVYYIRDWKCTFKNIHFPVQVFIILLFIGMNIMSFLAMYPSPYLLKSNDQFTLNEKEGIDWFKANSQGNDVVFIGLSEIMNRYGFTIKFPPYHFGYDKFPYLGSAINQDMYYISSKLDRLLYIEVLPKVAPYRWQPEDFDRLKIDKSVDKYYSNGETEIWFAKKV